jgi:hypothetical protein
VRKSEVILGQVYRAKVSGGTTLVRLTAESPYGGWVAINLATKREVRIKTAGRLRPGQPVVKPATVAEPMYREGSIL